jgi:hypothetical protein
MLIICVGLKRAASTLQYQICRELIRLQQRNIIDYGYSEDLKEIQKAVAERKTYDYSIIKTHCYFDYYKSIENFEGIVFLSSYRDLRDASLSVMEAYSVSLNDLISRKWFENEMKTLKNFEELQNCLIQEYYQLTEKLDESIRQITKFLNIKVDNSIINNLKNSLNKKAQLKKIDHYNKSIISKTIRIINSFYKRIIPIDQKNRILLFNKDKKTGLHFNHINKQSNKWEYYFTLGEKKLIKNIIGQWLIKYGYESENNW